MIMTLPERGLEKQINNVDNSSIKITFLNPKHIRLDNFRLGNIILGIYISEREDVDTMDEELKYLLDINDNNQYLSYLDSVKEKIKNGDLLFISIESSYGVEGFVLCEGIKVE